MTQRIVVSALAVAGVLLVVLGLSWKWFHPPEAYWSKEQAQALVDAFSAVHAAEDARPHGPNDAGAADFLAARRHYDEVKAELDQARSARDRTSLYLAVAGLTLVVTSFALRYYWTGTTDEKGRQ